MKGHRRKTEKEVKKGATREKKEKENCTTGRRLKTENRLEDEEKAEDETKWKDRMKIRE